MANPRHVFAVFVDVSLVVVQLVAKKLPISLNRFPLIFSVRARCQTSPGSRSPERVLMILNHLG
jgi:hypothetical protein